MSNPRSTPRVYTLAVLLSLISSTTWANRICYGTDFDGDQYAPNSAVQMSVAEANDLYCVSSYIEKNGDCDDRDPNVHPRAAEIGDNGKDDNCNGDIDEPTPYFTRPGWGTTTSSFDMLVAVNDSTFATWPIPLSAEVELRDLRNSTVSFFRSNLSAPVTNGLARLTVPGLSATTVYKARVRFSICFFSCETTPWSSEYYATTAGTTQKSNVRTAMVSSALYEWKESKYQVVGYNGKQSIDGKRYGADGGEMWCSEFYTWVGNPYLKWDGSRPSTVEGVLESFAAYGGSRPVSDVTAWADRGDYLALDTNSDGKKNHSAMVLAWDWSTWTFWTVEGNSGNEVQVNQRALGEIKGFGHITYSMLR